MKSTWDAPGTHLDVRHDLTHHQQEGGDEANAEGGAEEGEDCRRLCPEPALGQVEEREEAEAAGGEEAVLTV